MGRYQATDIIAANMIDREKRTETRLYPIMIDQMNGAKFTTNTVYRF